MRILYAVLILGIGLTASSYMIGVNRPKPSGSWEYDLLRNRADSSSWTNLNQVEIDFFLVDSLTSNYRRYIGLCFNMLPTADTTYKVVYRPHAVDEVAIHAIDEGNMYWSTGMDGAKVRLKIENGKMHFWCDKVSMEIIPLKGRSSTGPGNHTAFSFNLEER